MNVGGRAGPGAPMIAADRTGCGYDAPRWEDKFDPDRTTLALPLAPAASLDEDGRDTSEIPTPNLPAHGPEVLNVLAERGALPSSAIGEALGLKKAQTLRVLNRLVEAGLVERSGASRSTIYSVASH